MSALGNNRRFAHPLLDTLTTSVDHTPFRADSRFENFPGPVGPAPYRMDISHILHSSEMADITASNKLVFHVTGDTGNFKNDWQLDVAAALASDAHTSDAKFLYHLGDVIYDYGEDREYPDQFYEVYKDYHAPIVGIPGNHDGSEFSGGPDSLTGFMTNFCDTLPRIPPSLVAIGVDFGRDTMTQPNCYWTLTSPLFTIIGLYTNVPSGGVVQEPQISWFNNEMRAADPTKPLIVAMHHPIHSVAQNPSHRGSSSMKDLLQNACDFSGRVPSLVLAGHVHNYQRFTTKINGQDCSFVVAGCGGHAKDAISITVDSRNDTPAPNDPDVTINCATNRYVGFLQITATPGHLDAAYIAANPDGSTTQVDTFRI